MTNDEQVFDHSALTIGGMYRVPWSPNPHRLEEIRKRHCQLHGEFIGWSLCLRKRRNSETRPWGSVSVASASPEIILIPETPNAD
jgi:hypothetical protein